jgi:alkanesulfonate monooxygenase SsuD/methylene tetrahydromethanopterin reductase-like flavin-dependent oxidoreductase (luciferase family)
LTGHTPELLRPTANQIRLLAKAQGRDSLKLVASVLVILAETEEKAQAKFKELESYGDREGALALFGGWTGYDLGKYGDDEDFRFLDSAPPAIRSIVGWWATNSPDAGLKWNKKTIAEYLALCGNGARIVGSPKTVTVGNPKKIFVQSRTDSKCLQDELERWVEVSDIDGFNFSYATLPGTIDDMIEFLVPELQQRGLIRDDYPTPGCTLRENYIGKGNRLSKTHPGAKYSWKAGEEVPGYAKEA